MINIVRNLSNEKCKYQEIAKGNFFEVSFILKLMNHDISNVG